MNLEKKIQRRVGEALRKHRMVEAGDRLLIGVSGGKDSMTLAHVLAHKRRVLPIEFELRACHIVTDMEPRDEEWEARLDSYFEDIGVPLTRRYIPVIQRLDPKRKMNCFFCAMQRRMAIISIAKELECNKIAYGHHLDDIIETLLMNMFYNAEISTMPARLELDDHNLVIVRPLCLVKERETAAFARRLDVVEQAGPPCPYGEEGRRVRVKRLIAELAEEDERVRDNLSASLGRVKLGYLREKLREEKGD